MPRRLLIASLAVLAALSGPTDLAANAVATDLSRFLGATAAPVLRIDIHGRSLTERDLQDRLTVVSFVSAGCSILCVTRLMDLDKPARDPLNAARLARDPSSLDTFTQGLGHQPAPEDSTR